MKKIISICLALVMVLSLCVSVSAASFIESPSNNSAPIIIDYTNNDDDCTANVVVLPYGDRDLLSEDEINEIEKAYDDIINSDDLTELFSGLDKIVESMNIVSSDLAVSDLFHINYNDCEDHDEHGDFRIKLQSDTLNGFAGLVQIIDGEWVVVDGAYVEDNEYLVFSVDELSTFAIVVNKNKSETTSPITGDPTVYIAAGVALIVLISLFATGVVVNKKRV